MDSFQPFILSVLAETSLPYLERNSIAETIHDKFGIDIPAMVVRSLLRTMNKSGLTERVGDTAVSITEKGLKSAPTLEQEVTQYQRRQAELVGAFEGFVKERFADHLGLIADIPGKQLASYFERHAAPLLNEGLRGRKAGAESNPGADFLVAAFVSHLAASDQVRFGYVVEAAKGAMLAAVLLLDTSGLNESLKSLHLVLDTPVLMDALGFHGELAENATKQLISLAVAQSAKLVTFDHCVSELEGILEHVSQALRNGNRSRSTSPGYLHFADVGATPADIAVLQPKVSELLGHSRIDVIGRPDGYYEYGLDEQKLEDLIQSKVHYFQDSARVNDVLSLSSTHRMRKGRRVRTLEHCRAVLVTSNSNLVRGAVEFDERGDRFPLAISTEALASVLWVRSPAAAPEAPREMLLAAAYAGMQPNPSVWSKYLDEVERLEAADVVSADEAVILRTSRVSREALMEETLGESDALNAESPLAVLDRVKREATGPLQQQVHALEAEAAVASAAVSSAIVDVQSQVEARRVVEVQYRQASRSNQELQAQLDKQIEAEQTKRSNIRRRAEKVAHGWRLVIAWSVGALSVVAIAWAGILFLTLPDPGGHVGIVLVGLAGFVALALAVSPPLGKVLDPLERGFVSRGERRRLLDAGYSLPSGLQPATRAQSVK